MANILFDLTGGFYIAGPGHAVGDDRRFQRHHRLPVVQGIGDIRRHIKMRIHYVGHYRFLFLSA